MTLTMCHQSYKTASLVIPLCHNIIKYHTYTEKKNNSFTYNPLLALFYLKIKTGFHSKYLLKKKKHTLFFKTLLNLTQKIKTITQHKYKKHIIWDDNMNHISGNTIILNGRITQECSIFDTQRNTSMLNPSISNNVIDVIFSFSYVQIVSPLDEIDTLYGKIIIEIVQIRIHNHTISPLEQYAFDTTHNKHNSTYNTYFDMLQKGVPRKAVEQRMICDGIDVGVLDGKIPKTSHKQPQKLLFSAQDLKNTKLKKVIPHKKNTPKHKGIHLGISLESIQNTLKSLRKTRLINNSYLQ